MVYTPAQYGNRQAPACGSDLARMWYAMIVA